MLTEIVDASNSALFDHVSYCCPLSLMLFVCCFLSQHIPAIEILLVHVGPLSIFETWELAAHQDPKFNAKEGQLGHVWI